GVESGRNNGPQAAKGRAGKLHGGPSGRQIYHSKVTKENPIAESGSERLGTGFLCGKAFCVGCGPVGAAFGEMPLGRGEDAIKKTVAMARDCALDAADIDEIRPDAEDHVIESESAGPPLPSPPLAGERERPRSMAARMRRTASARPPMMASPMRKWPILSST